MTDQPIDDDTNGLTPAQLAWLATASNEFAQARRMQAALAGGDADAITRIAAEVAVGDPVGAFMAACTEAVQAARQLWGDDTEAILAERALRQIDQAQHNRDQLGHQ
jgi:hypothetical protein